MSKKPINRQSLVLKRMVDNHFITQQQADSALSEKLVFVPPTIHIKAPHFTMLVKDALIKKYGRELVEEGGLQVYTTLDLTTQRMAEDVVHQQLAAMGKAYRINNGAAMVTNPQTGEVLAMVGSADYFDPTIKGNVNVTTSLRQPGSSIKPINYAYAFENGGYTPGSVIDDSPITFPIPGQAPYTPHNYDGTFKGPMTLRLALAQSRNIPPVKLLQKYGVDKMLQEARKMGITTWNNPERYGLSLTLGGAEVSMLDMTTAYGTIATMGVRHDPMILLKVVDAQGKILVDNTKGSENNDHFFAGVIRPAVASDGVPEEYVWQSGTRVFQMALMPLMPSGRKTVLI
jgi:membrane peptidoglycan carboxypeptidase